MRKTLDSLGCIAKDRESAHTKKRIRAYEDWWFDTTRHVKTAGYAKPEAATVVGKIRDSNVYAPIRAANAHEALRDLPIPDLSEYTFIDIGSGKGRMLFIAAEYPFRKVVGVEFSTELHAEAQENIERYRHASRRCSEIESICADAAEFPFPNKKLVIYLFNSFGPDIMAHMLANLSKIAGGFSAACNHPNALAGTGQFGSSDAWHARI